ncbi:MAG: response regulator transcription factor [Chitinophagales bacterium]
MTPTRVFIVDDHSMVVEGIRTLLSNEKSVEIIGHANNASACRAFIKQQLPDVILLDINLPDVNGIDLCREISGKYPTIKIIALSTSLQTSYIRKMIEYGAKGYLLKNCSKEELLGAIEMVMIDREYYSREVAQQLRQAENGPDIPVLTRREKEILHLISDGMTNADIAKKIFVEVSTVDSHRKNLLEKFKVNNTALLVKKAVLLGFVN